MDDIGLDASVTNADRADWARIGLSAFAERTHQYVGDDDSEATAEVVSDFLADLHHFCDGTSMSWAEMLDRADGHYRGETFADEVEVLLTIQGVMSGQQWSSDTTSQIAEIMVAAGYEIEEPE